jgi:rfaE bifunctional protein nucleotidyltransferase chain/domain
MNLSWEKVKSKIKNWEELKFQIETWKSENKKVVFTNGCFDILHYGHINYLSKAKDKGDYLVVALNSANSISKLKGTHRPINDDLTRLHIMASLEFVDVITVFEEDTPYELIKTVAPNILVKGGDWKPEEIVGSDIVIANGGEVKSLPFIEGYSTSGIESKIKKQAMKELKSF